MARVPTYVWDIGLALALFLLYLELKNINLVSSEEKQLWDDYYRRQRAAASGQQGNQHGSIFDAVGGFLGGVFNAVGGAGDMGGGGAGVRTM